MKLTLFLYLTVISLNLIGQTSDSLVVREVDSLIKVCKGLASQQQFNQSLKIISSAEDLAITKVGQESVSYGNCCMTHGTILYFMGEYKEAVPWYLKAKIIREKTLGKVHLDYARILNNLALVYKNIGYYEKAEPLYLETFSIQEKLLGREHPEFSYTLNNLATLYQKMGFFSKSEKLLLESKEIKLKVFGKQHPEYAACLSNLALLYHDWGHLDRAEPLALEAKAIRKQTLGIEDLDYAESLNNLANLYSDLGQYNKAESFFLEEKNIYERKLGKEHPDYAMSLVNLVAHYTDIKQFEKATPLLQEAMLIQEKTLGKEHPDYALSLGLQSKIYNGLGQVEKAITVLKEAMEFNGITLGKEHPSYVSMQINLASLYLGLNQYKQAEPLLLSAKAIFESGTVYRDQFNYLNCLILLAKLYFNQGQFKQAESLIVEQVALNRLLLNKSLNHLSEQELNEYMKIFSRQQEQILTYRQNYQSGVLSGIIYDDCLFHKGFLMKAVNHLRQLASQDSIASEKFSLMRAYRNRLAMQYSLPYKEQDSALIAELEDKSLKLEKEIVYIGINHDNIVQDLRWYSIKEKLKPGEAAVEFVRFHDTGTKQEDRVLYSAMILLPQVEQPIYIPLFEEKSLDSLIHFGSVHDANYVNNLYSLANRGAVALEAPVRSLYEILWRPMDKALSGVKTIYFSPSGLLNRINLDAIPISETESLADKYILIEILSTRQLATISKNRVVNNDAVLFGGLKFDADTTISSENQLVVSNIISQQNHSQTSRQMLFGNWEYIPFTAREVDAVAKIMNSNGINPYLNKDYNGTEETFKRIGANKSPSARILHIATHGYFFPDPNQTFSNNGGVAQDSEESKRTVKSSSPSLRFSNEKEPIFKSSENPMLRSGLILVGANYTWKGGRNLEEREDGIVTAFEISQMNLVNTELVVLSACETGLGDIHGYEGVYGLQRAFKIAGAKYLIMSLWQVPDKQTSLLMTTFYKKWLEDKMYIPDAFHAAQKELRELGFDPYQWAGFVLIE
ncbi:MAG: CHAT domain-containing protein [Saprospiraceae bacterium]|nr:CHAT domain-containing protein [Saprospiraceae bacterium]HMW38758.1 CHAT domain-containing protein [Saprospiraceae bacterium]HMX89037.1 CHAT domain-containing protein [Saprospiraceae bacterium]HMZ40933.1 CHAT domain-containing protein [Saprospiraceae bacterium]HNA64464.1 CHAT domain-containing protein [Saprospiraceae bacterium]